ncbi:MAG: alanine--tRNA ligase-related protein [Patescibacteria group bacterium]
MLQALDIFEKYINFFEKKRHKRISNSPLIPQNDPTTLFTSSGMQPLVPYLLGEKHPQGLRLVNAQNCFRAQDIDEIGDNRHTTFFRMLGNWSLGDYFKKEQIPWYWEFLTKEIGLPKDKLYITVFKGFESIPRDEESERIWTEILQNEDLDPKEKISSYGVDKNWWSRAGNPSNMPEGEPGGPDSEVFFDFGTPHDKKYGEQCHPNCECGRFLEIGNSVFMEYQKTKDGFKALPNKNVDFGGGLERLLAAYENQSDVFQTSLISPIIKTVEEILKTEYKTNSRAMRIIADHLIASVFIASAGIYPSSKDQGYVLRRLIRRAIRYGKQLGNQTYFINEVAISVINNYSDTDPYLHDNKKKILDVLAEEEKKFSQAIQEGLRVSKDIISNLTPIEPAKYSRLMQAPDKTGLFREIYRGNIKKLNLSESVISNATISGPQAFNLYQSFGFPIEMVTELAQDQRLLVDIESFDKKLKEHQEKSRLGGARKFAGGLADHSEKTVMGHTATHLLHQALRDVLGDTVHQTGSNITSERVRFDFSYEEKLTDEDILKVEEIVNKKISENLPVHFEMMPLERAKEIGAIGLFDDKYAEDVKVYFVGPSAGSGRPYSAEFCGGPHVDFTGRLKKFKIIKQDNIGNKQRRLYSKVHDI